MNYRKLCRKKRIGGRNFQEPRYKQWRKDIYKRDGYTCQMPNCNMKKSLQAHHIFPWSSHPSMRYMINNGITLCRKCHDSIRGNETVYVHLFMKILNGKVQGH